MHITCDSLGNICFQLETMSDGDMTSEITYSSPKEKSPGALITDLHVQDDEMQGPSNASSGNLVDISGYSSTPLKVRRRSNNASAFPSPGDSSSMNMHPSSNRRSSKSTLHESRRSKSISTASNSFSSNDKASKNFNPLNFKHKYDPNFLKFPKCSFHEVAAVKEFTTDDLMDIDLPIYTAAKKNSFPEHQLFSAYSRFPNVLGDDKSVKEQNVGMRDYMMNFQVQHLHSHSQALSDSAPIVPLSNLKDDASFSSRRRDIDSKSDSASSAISTGLLQLFTHEIVAFFKLCDPSYHYDESKNPKRVLTKPNKGVHNHGYDNENHDYILYVNDTFGNEEGRKFLVLDLLGHGTFGQVAKCLNLKTKETVAIKIIKNQSAYFNQSMMEVTILELLNQKYDYKDLCHITRMLDTFIYKKHLCIVFSLLSLNLFELIKQNHFRGFNHTLIKIFLTQILNALKLLNEAKIIHCDLKPENILLKRMDSPEIKVIDFGSACHEQHTVYTYIQSRFYRSPEILLGLPYNSSIDSWSLGCIAAELYLGLPLFPGHSNYDQVSRIVNCLGLPPFHMMEKGKTASLYFEKLHSKNDEDQSGTSQSSYSTKKGYAYRLRPRDKTEKPSKKYFPQTVLRDIIMEYQPRSSSSSGPSPSSGTAISSEERKQRECFLDFLQGLLKYNPLERWTPQQARKHPYITGEPWTGLPFQPPGTVLSSQLKRTGPTSSIPIPISGHAPASPNVALESLSKAAAQLPTSLETDESHRSQPSGPAPTEFQRPRAFTINSQLFNIPPQIQRLANAATINPNILVDDSIDYSLQGAPIHSNDYNSYYPSAAMMRYPYHHQPSSTGSFTGLGGFSAGYNPSMAQNPWFAPPGGPSQNIIDYRRDYLFSASGLLPDSTSILNNPAPLFNSNVGSFNGSSASILSRSGSLNGDSFPQSAHSASNSGNHTLLGISKADPNNGRRGTLHAGNNSASLDLGRYSSYGGQLPSFSLPNSYYMHGSMRVNNPFLLNDSSFQGSPNFPIFAASGVPRQPMTSPTSPTRITHSVHRPSMSAAALPVLFDEDHPAHDVNQQNSNNSNYQYNPLVYTEQSFLPYQMINNHGSSLNAFSSMNNYYVSGGGLPPITHSIHQRRVSNPPIPPYQFFQQAQQPCGDRPAEKSTSPPSTVASNTNNGGVSMTSIRSRGSNGPSANN